MSFPPTVGRYRIDRVLGSGAFASVWLGHDEALDSQVAIKVLSGSLIDDLDVRNRFLEEARILRRADSERLVRVHDIGELPDGRPYFVMSYADRGTLADRMRERPLPVADALVLAEEIAYGVEVINTLGVIHRDLKPSNVLFQSTPDGGEKLLIADLGLAKALAHASGAFTLPVGTPGYMSPEQARFGGGLDVRADVYGLGALTYHMLTGRPPGPAPIKVAPSELREGMPAAFDGVILRALEVEREKRWPTAEAFAEALATLRPTMPPGTKIPSYGPGGEPEPTVREAEPTIQDEPYAGPRQTPPGRPVAGAAGAAAGAAGAATYGPPPQPGQQAPGQPGQPAQQGQPGQPGQAPGQTPGQTGQPDVGQGLPGPPPPGPGAQPVQQPPGQPMQGQQPPPGQGQQGPGGPPRPGAPGPVAPVPGGQGTRYPADPEASTREDRGGEDELHTTEMQLPPRPGQQGQPGQQNPLDDDITIMDHPGNQPGGSPQPRYLQSTDPDPEDRTVAVPLPPQYQQPQDQGAPPPAPQGEEGKTAVFPVQGGGQPQQGGHPHGPPPTGFQPPHAQPPEGAQGPQGQGQGPLGKLKGFGRKSGRPPQQQQQGGFGQPGQPGQPGHFPSPSGTSGGGGGDGDRGSKKFMTPLIITAVVLSVALVGGLLLGNIFNGGGGGKKQPPKPPALPQDFTQVADSSTKIKAAVPKAWVVSPQGQKTWSTTVAGLVDPAARPVLRATPNLAQFPGTGTAPGLFVGLTTDMAPGKLPPPSLISHTGCTAGAKENYVSPDKALTGTIQRFTGCKAGTASVTEIGLRDQSGKYGAWVRIKETDNRNLSKVILDNLKLGAPA
ncbi:serine/threonine-protein kinase [Actinomadura barringtoniae]|uniref:serine/threonine-protein kinase n=1 Tax=Actinomadura barringtoniae TaxID=1427535 RepID=UPI0027DDB062|nr:serine/threonine-protein kinase [Actinomadura barringtoniae]